MRKTSIAALSLIALLTIVLSPMVNAQGVMTTSIGNGTLGYTGDGGPANLAEINQPNDVCFDAAHNLYFADKGNNVIRKVSATTGIISTIAGNGSQGYAGDNGAAINATLSEPSYLCVDVAGNLYFSDLGNNVIRKVSATGYITTIAGNGTSGYLGDGGAATNAQLNGPQGICIDGSGNIYFADSYNNVIRKIVITTGIITTFAGAANYPGAFYGDGGIAQMARLYYPMCLCFDHTYSNMYISDVGNGRIRRVFMSSNIISTIAGNGSSTFSNDGGPALHAGLGYVDGICVDTHGDVYIDDVSCSCRKINMATGIINVVAGDGIAMGYNGDGGLATDEFLSRPAGLCIDPSNGNIIIADNGNDRIRMATQPGYVPTDITKLAPSQLKIFPNPSPGKFAIQTDVVLQNATIEINNFMGINVYAGALTGSQNTIDIGNQPAGVYYLNIKSAACTETRKITISK